MLFKNQNLRVAINEIKYYVSYDGKEFGGVLAPTCNIITGWLEKSGLNRTLIPVDTGFGEFNPTTGDYSGILGMLQRNKADIALDPNVDFGRVQGNGVTRGQLMECDPPAIVSGYDSRTRVSTADILVDTFLDIGPLNVCLFYIAILILTLILRKRGYHRSKRLQTQRPIMSVVHYLMQKIPIKVFSVRTLLVSITLTLILFFVLLAFNSLLHVNLVKIDPPKMVISYDDIIDRLNKNPISDKIFKVSFSNEYPDTELFRTGPEGSKENEIWRKNSASGGPYFIKLGASTVADGAAISSQDMVVIINKGYSKFVRNLLCDWTSNMDYFHAWISVDNDAKWNQKGYVVRESLSGPLRSWLDKRTMYIIESGVIGYMYRVVKDLRLLDRPSERTNCSSETIMIQDYHSEFETSLGHVPFRVMYIICTVLMTLAVIALSTEKFIKKISK